MIMTMTSSQFGLDDMETLPLLVPSSPMADPMDLVLLHPDLEEPERGETSSLEGGASPLSFLSSSLSSSSSSPPPFYSPPPSPPALLLQEDKAGSNSDLLSIPWLAHHDLPVHSHAGADEGKEDVFCDLDWMTERIDLSELDIDSLIGSCGADDEPSSSPEDILASLDCPMELDSLPLAPFQGLSDRTCPSLPAETSVMAPDVSTPSVPHKPPLLPTVEPASLYDTHDTLSPPPYVPEPQEELEIKSEPVSPAPDSPVYALDLGSEVDVSECEEVCEEVKPAVVPQVPRIVLSLSPTRIVLLLAPKDEVGVATATVTTTNTPTTTPDVPQSSPTPSTPARSPRSRPYPDPKSRPGPAPSTTPGVKVKSARGAGGEVSKTVKDKKTKKMEQNKTAATRYRQKKRSEQSRLTSEYSELERRNIELTEKAESMAREIQYLKELMEEVRLASIKKGLGLAI